MWLLINVDDDDDVGKDENKRYLLSDNISITGDPGSVVVGIMVLGTEIYPATKNIIDEIWCDDDDTL